MSSYVEAPGAASDQSVITRTATVQVPAGSRVARIPVGNFFYGKQDPQQTECLVTLNGIPQDWGADFAWYYNGITNPQPYMAQPPSVRDAATGVLFDHPMPAPSTVVFTWKQRILHLPCDQVMLARQVWDNASQKFTLDYELVNGRTWLPSGSFPGGTSITWPNSIRTAEQRPGIVVEVWRLTKRNRGGVRIVPEGPLYSAGARYLPYFRGPHPESDDPTVIPIHRILLSSGGYNPTPPGPGPYGGGNQGGQSGEATGRRQAFKVCFYDTNTGARGPLSPFSLVYSPRRIDRTSKQIMRTAGCLWIQTQ